MKGNFAQSYKKSTQGQLLLSFKLFFIAAFFKKFQ